MRKRAVEKFTDLIVLHARRISADPVLLCYSLSAGWSSLVARWAHNPKVGGSNPPPATNELIESKQVKREPRIGSLSFAQTVRLLSVFSQQRPPTGALASYAGRPVAILSTPVCAAALHVDAPSIEIAFWRDTKYLDPTSLSSFCPAPVPRNVTTSFIACFFYRILRLDFVLLLFTSTISIEPSCRTTVTSAIARQFVRALRIAMPEPVSK
jgi:hypothetical protein